MFFRGLQKVEQMLTTVAEAIGANEHHQPRQVNPIQVQDPALRSLSRPQQQVLSDTHTGSHSISEVEELEPYHIYSSAREYELYFERNLTRLKSQVLENLEPKLSQELKNQFLSSLQQEINWEKQLKQIESTEDNVQQENVIAQLQHAQEESRQVASQLIDLVTSTLQKNGLQSTIDRRRRMLVLQCTIISDATPKSLASYATKGYSQSKQIRALLESEFLMEEIINSGLPKRSNYVKMLEIYHDILTRSDKARNGVENNDIFHRLALATALEHSSPVKIFDTGEVIDPLERFLHYEQAYMNGELDPAFESFTTWELRMIVNNDASNEEIKWCRDMLMNYRPDHILDRNDRFKYCMIVKSDVRYKRPEWLPNVHRTYQQLISCGGMCGPRAWFGRAICKSFGVPTWGVRQPGHAAMSCWTPTGWEIVLGGPNWKRSWWEECNGVEFELETKARERRDLYRNTTWLKCFAKLNQEDVIGSQNQNYLNRVIVRRFWTELLRFQMIVIKESINGQKKMTHNKEKVASKLVHSTLQNHSTDEIIVKPNGDIFIPSATTKTHQQNGKMMIMKSFHSDICQQVHIRENGSVEYEVNASEEKRYKLKMSVASVHREICETPLELNILNVYTKDDYIIEIPYTKGHWQETKEIEIILHPGKNRLRFSREDGFGLSISHISLQLIKL
ncbi:hypothetical protein CTEN210_08006 [Chaetoceros tenuissimus]|uniref:Uncharacterized protein n=1 Tax=Chaetoceros tenuissimus TaxID=426638 RepID=A0AAD3H5V8_9STRA|nr:hypothetical protein CTEN210_08006 [Chaetoceros tenuissimus]